MTIKINRHNLLWIIGVMQPISPPEIYTYLNSVLRETGDLPSEKWLHDFCLREADLGTLIRITRYPDLFSLTMRGNHSLQPHQRKSRDIERIFLLRQARSAMIRMSRGGGNKSGSGGDSPSAAARLTTEGTEANKPGLFVPRVQSYWPRFSKQLHQQTGTPAAPRDSDLLLLSYANIDQLALACGNPIVGSEITFTTLGAILGLSPGLIQRMALYPNHYYRTFYIHKSSGGQRRIDAPRAFIKLVQHFILDYCLHDAIPSNHVHSYCAKRSIISNAKPHTGRPFVANIDIDNFFGSIRKEGVERVFVDLGYSTTSAATLALLCCKNGCLPQGAPTSPMLSNLFLKRFDDEFAAAAGRLRVCYTRFADDMTLSGAKKQTVIEMTHAAEIALARSYGLRLNKQKTRIASSGCQQRVAGLVVNEKAFPPRLLRRQIRAAFHRASQHPTMDNTERARLSGYFSYLSAFTLLRRSKELRKYKAILARTQTKS